MLSENFLSTRSFSRWSTSTVWWGATGIFADVDGVGSGEKEKSVSLQNMLWHLTETCAFAFRYFKFMTMRKGVLFFLNKILDCLKTSTQHTLSQKTNNFFALNCQRNVKTRMNRINVMKITIAKNITHSECTFWVVHLNSS